MIYTLYTKQALPVDNLLLNCGYPVDKSNKAVDNLLIT